MAKETANKYWNIGCRSLGADSKRYILIIHVKLTLIMSSHVDDLKGGGTAETQELVLVELRKMFDGELKVQMEQLKPINVDAYVMSDVQAEVDDQTKQSFQSLLDGVAWMTQTCTTICIYVAYLQRKGKAPTVRSPFP